MIRMRIAERVGATERTYTVESDAMPADKVRREVERLAGKTGVSKREFIPGLRDGHITFEWTPPPS